ncbi:type II secretion system inner membrane protein GspF [Parasphingopyxis algicola]|uniref:type II secretion system inner membrane protein GspF n=1 Tax=Parasphingopyxis algicola TaxID=2026624 RepID=UPI0015A09FAC|nr:type II secretion system inner membrane protein GspF [Parasphingopyxis algicola]QLC23883.1 type II secretion system inner membrane protein GspF [Parasphingopyxis algicola]
MPSFDYLALDTAGREKRGTVDGETLEAARARLDARRLYVVRIAPGTGGPRKAAANDTAPLLSRSIELRNHLSAKELTLFTRQLSTLVDVSPLEEALRTIALQAEKQRVRRVLETVHAGVVEGQRLARAMEREEKSFPPLYRAMIAAGEGSGALPSILARLADLQERQAEVRGKVLTALAYPIMLTIVAIAVVFALMIFVVPQVVEQFDSVGQQLPLLTRIVIGLSNFLANWWWALLLVLALAGFSLWRALQNPDFRLRFDRRLLRLPILGRLIRDLHAARMARTLATMIGSRLPVLEGLTLTAKTVRNAAQRQASEEVAEAVRQGGSLSAALRKADIFPPLLVYMASSGEASGQLDVMLERAADYLEREFDAFTSAMLSLLEPAIIIVMGVIVTLIVLAILLPILQLNTLAVA